MLAPKHREEAGTGALAVELGPGRSRVTRALAHSPLRLLEPRNAGSAAWVFAATFGGGLLDGDRVELDIAVGAGAAALVGTQAQTKVFRTAAGGVGALQTVRAEVADGGLLVWLPDPVVCFAGARYAQSIDVRVGADAGAVLIEGLTAGRSARGERWAFDRFASRTRLWGPGGTLWLDDAVVLDPAHGELGGRMRRWDALATVTVVGPRAAGVAEGVRAAAGWRLDGEALVAVSDVAGGVVARVAGSGNAAVAGAVRRLLGGLPALLGDDPFARKW